jgi:hypothetical protein
MERLGLDGPGFAGADWVGHGAERRREARHGIAGVAWRGAIGMGAEM